MAKKNLRKRALAREQSGLDAYQVKMILDLRISFDGLRTREARAWDKNRWSERAKAESTARTLQAELTELRVESRKALETVTSWVERASRAGARLEELAGRKTDK